MGAVRTPLAPPAAVAAGLAAGIACAHAAALAGPTERPEVTAAAIVAWILLTGSAAAGLGRPAGWGVVAIAVCYVAGLGFHDGADPAAPLEAAALVLAWELCQWPAELRERADTDPGWLARRVLFVSAQALAAAAVGWVALAPSSAGRIGGLVLTAAGAVAAVFAVGLAVRLARRAG
ncbi:MAG: hypothetical protein ACTHNU_17805 [Gaiellales bacterium]